MRLHIGTGIELTTLISPRTLPSYPLGDNHIRAPCYSAFPRQPHIARSARPFPTTLVYRPHLPSLLSILPLRALLATPASYIQIGVGSIGGLLAHHLRRSLPSAQISLLLRQGREFVHASEEEKRVQIQVRSQGVLRTSAGYEVEPLIGEDLSTERINSLLVCLKAHQTPTALARIAHRIGPSSVISLLQNGIGVYQQLCADIWPDPRTRPHFVLGSTTHGARRLGTGDFQLVHTSQPGHGEIQWGVAPDPRQEIDIEDWLWQGSKASSAPLLSPAPAPPLPLAPPPQTPTDLAPLHNTLTALLTTINLSPRIVPFTHMQHAMLVKVALNSIINPLTAVIGAGALPNGSLLGSKPATHAMNRLAGEAQEVITAHLHNNSPDGRAPPDVVRLFSRDALVNRAQALCKATGENLSSMAVDVSNGMETEIKYINGHISALGRKYGIPTPANDLMIDLVKITSEVSGFNSPRQKYNPEKVWHRRDEIAARAKADVPKLSGGRLAHIRTRQAGQAQRAQARAAGIPTKASIYGPQAQIRQYSTPSRSAKVQHSQPARDLALNMSDLIASAPRQSRYWDLEGEHLVERPKALGPPESLTRKFQAAANTANAVAKTTADLTKGGLGSALDALIAASPRQERTWAVQADHWQGLMKKKAQHVQKKAVDAVVQTASSVDSAIAMGTAAIPRLPRKALSSASASDGLSQVVSWRSELDSLITAAPRQERTWGAGGGELVPLPNNGQASALASMVGKGYTGQQLARGGLGGVMDSMIAASPRQERTYDWKPTQTRIGGRAGRFNTSKSSGS